MQELVTITTTKWGENEEQETVNARELHTKLEVGRDFSTWIKDKIERYGFIENEDYLIAKSGYQDRVSPQFGENLGGRPATEYYLTLDTAKEIAMVENNEIGRSIRKYFINYEKIGRQDFLDTKRRNFAQFTVKATICQRYATIANFVRAHNLSYTRTLKALSGIESSIAVETAIKNSLGLDLRELHGKPSRLTANNT